jgi:hypothetical protein
MDRPIGRSEHPRRAKRLDDAAIGYLIATMKAAFTAYAWILSTILLGQDSRPPAEPPRPDCAACADIREFPCPSCLGAGVGDMKCLRCFGATRIACPRCGLDAALPSPATFTAAGALDCPNLLCRDGRVRWMTFVANKPTDVDQCLLCSAKGRVDCPTCASGVVKCPDCGGRGSYERACSDCAGTGKLRCRSCRSDAPKSKTPDAKRRRDAVDAACVLCFGAGSRACPRHPSPSPAGRACAFCFGSAITPCDRCLGPKKIGCGGCASTGRMRTTIVGGGAPTAGGVAKHGPCSARGHFPCSACDSKGRSTCVSCSKGRTDRPCVACDGDGWIRCRGCVFGAWRGFEILGIAYDAAGRRAAAAACFSEAEKLMAAQLGAYLDSVAPKVAGAEPPPKEVRDLLDQLKIPIDKPETSARSKRVEELKKKLHLDAAGRLKRRVAASGADRLQPSEKTY